MNGAQGALVQDLEDNWCRIIPSDGSPVYYWNTTTNVRQWNAPRLSSDLWQPEPAQTPSFYTPAHQIHWQQQQ